MGTIYVQSRELRERAEEVRAAVLTAFPGPANYHRDKDTDTILHLLNFYSVLLYSFRYMSFKNSSRCSQKCTLSSVRTRCYPPTQVQVAQQALRLSDTGGHTQ